MFFFLQKIVMILLSRIKHSENFTETSELKQTRILVASVNEPLTAVNALWPDFYPHLPDKNNAININNAKA